MEEKRNEQYLTKEVKKRGGLCLKFISPSMAGVPDRIILMPGGRVYFCEVKAKGKKPRPLQLSAHRLFERLGFEVFVVDCKTDVDDMIRRIEGGKTDGIHSA